MTAAETTTPERTPEPRPEVADERVGARDSGLIGARVSLPLRRVMPSLRRVTALVLGGILVGFVVSGMVAELIAGGIVTGRPAEPVETRAYIQALLARDATRLAALQPATDPGSQAAAFQQSATSSLWTAEKMSYLGGATLGTVGIYVYVVQVKSPDGTTEESVPFAFTVTDKKIVRVQ